VSGYGYIFVRLTNFKIDKRPGKALKGEYQPASVDIIHLHTTNYHSAGLRHSIIRIAPTPAPQPCRTFFVDQNQVVTHGGKLYPKINSSKNSFDFHPSPKLPPLTNQTFHYVYIQLQQKEAVEYMVLAKRHRHHRQ